jgi:hypothetical protein
LSRHRTIQCSRAKAVALIAAGAFVVAGTATAAAVTWSPGPSGPAAGRTHEADAGSLLTISGQTLQMQAFTGHTFQMQALAQSTTSEQSTASQALQAYQIRDVAAELSATHWKTARERAAQQAPAAQPAAQATSQSTATSQPTASAQPTAAVTTFAAPVASGSPQQIAEAMLGSFGWSSSQFSCLDPLWAHESGWSVTAYNAGSGAYGIPQALPGSRMASAGPDWQTSAATQIRWGLEYIKGTYGSPCGAWDHEQATGWY